MFHVSNMTIMKNKVLDKRINYLIIKSLKMKTDSYIDCCIVFKNSKDWLIHKNIDIKKVLEWFYNLIDFYFSFFYLIYYFNIVLYLIHCMILGYAIKTKN